MTSPLKQQLCEHDFTYGGVKYELGDQCPGSGSHYVIYYDFYFCRKCLVRQYQKIDATSNTYQNILFNATPKETP